MTQSVSLRRTPPRVWAAAASILAVAVLAFVATTLVLGAKREPSTAGVNVHPPLVVTEADGQPTITPDQLRALGGVRQDGNVIGSPHARVVVVEFEDLQCVACRQYDLSVSDHVVTDLVRPGTVQVRRYPLTFVGPQSVAAARWAYAAGQQDRMWQFLRAFHLNAGAENSGYVTDEHLRQIAALVPGLDLPRASRDAASTAAQTFLDSSRTLAARLDVTGTPAVLVGTDMAHLRPVALHDSSDYASLRSAVDVARRGGHLTPRSTPASAPPSGPALVSETTGSAAAAPNRCSATGPACPVR